MTKTTAKSVEKIVDELGRVKAKIAELEEKEQDLRDELAQSGLDEVEGSLFRATISTYVVARTDYKAVVEALPPSSNLKRLVTNNTTEQERTTVKVVAR